MYNKIKIDIPESGQNRTYSIAEDDSARLTLKSEDIDAVALGAEGELVINLKNGGQVTLINFEKFNAAGNFIYLNDGTLLNFAALTQPPPEETLETTDVTAETEVNSQTNPDTVCEIDPSEVTTIDDDGELVVRLADGKEIPIDGTVITDPKEVTVCKTILIQPEDHLTKTTDVETKLAQMAPAAGDGADETSTNLQNIAEQLNILAPEAGDGALGGNSGYGFNSSFSVTDFNAPDDIGPLGPTQLLYTAPVFEQENPLIPRIIADDSPSLSVDSQIVDETNFDQGVLTKNGSVLVNFGNDGAGSISGNSNFTSSDPTGKISLTSGGEPVTVTFDTATNSYIGTIHTNHPVHSEITIFTLKLDPLTGEYVYTQFETLDHADQTDHNDPIFLDFGVTVRDSDGDAASDEIRVTVLDDGPQISNITRAIDETHLNGQHEISVHGTINHDFGEDGKGAITPNGTFHFLTQVGGQATQLTSNGQPVHVTKTGNGYIGKVGHKTIFTLDIDPHDGDFKYAQFEAIDHPDAHNPDDVVWLKFYVDITDFDGDTDTGVIVIDVHDDGPRAHDDSLSFRSSNRTASGNVLNNDNFGVDGAGHVVTTGSFQGNFGTLTLNSDGSYQYVLNHGVKSGHDTFYYTMQDFDGDKDSAKLVINISPPPPPPSPPPPPPPTGDGDGDGDGGDGSPLILDLDGDGIELTTKDGGVLFDIDLDGKADQTAWVEADDGLLALDINNDGIINDRSELFGDTNGFSDGFANLKSYDSNKDNVIDAKDDIWSSLLVWQDKNQDGISDQNELLTLDELGIINLDLSPSTPDNFYLKDNWVSHVGHYTLKGGEQRSLVDAWFQYNGTANTNDNNTISIKDNFESAQAVMNIQGNGSFSVAEFKEGNILTHEGEEINVTFDNNTNIYFGATSDKIIFNMKIEEDGEYQFNLFDSIDQCCQGDGHASITLQFGVVGENNKGDETHDYVSIDVKGMSSQFAHATDESIDIMSFLEGTDKVAEYLDKFIEDTEVVSSINNANDNHLSAFNNTAGFGELENQQTDII